ncbi:type I restriction enzyme S subunit [Pseudomonas frederiksbergensis]|uniref:restriction endonuclease subunit S n=1 Tax=Pseudomonas frederiksbergensis TaxID=104087 RepID=UPI003D228FD1
MAGKYKAYPEYKNSENPWLGDVPKDWDLIPLKYLSRVSGGGTPSKDNPEYWNGNIPWVSPKDMKTPRILSTIDNVTEKAIKESSTNLLSKGALLVVVRSGILQHSIPVAINDVPVTLNQDMKALRFNGKLNVKYAMYLIVGNQKALLLEWRKQGATVESIEQEYLANTIFPVPSLNEQGEIIRFLDCETAKIDTLIEKQKLIIQLLKEKHQAVISHAVTKGLNTDAKMCNSGIEWLGEVPEHWEVKSLRYLGFCQNGINIGAEYFGSGYPFVSYGDVYRNGVLPEHVSGLVQSSENDRKAYSVIAGDVIFTRTSETIDEIGLSSVCLSTISDASFAGFLIRFRPKNRTLDPGFSKYYFRSILLRGFFTKEMNLVTRASLSQDLLKKLPVPLPALDEQRQIANFLDKKSLAFSKLIENAESAINLSKERRTALISAAVTGKIDVRDWGAKKLSQTNREVAA